MKYVIVLFLLGSCVQPVNKFPRVAKNECGTYAVQVSHNEKTDAILYLGVVKYRPHYECYGDTMYATSGSGFIIGGGAVLYGPADCGYDTTNVEVLKTRKHQQVWSGIKDTSYDWALNYELQFKTEAGATAAMNSYIRRTSEYNAFVDSITRCHTYK